MQYYGDDSRDKSPLHMRRIIFTDLQLLVERCEPKFSEAVGFKRSRCSAEELWSRLWLEAGGRTRRDGGFLGNLGILLEPENWSAEDAARAVAGGGMEGERRPLQLGNSSSAAAVDVVGDEDEDISKIPSGEQQISEESEEQDITPDLDWLKRDEWFFLQQHKAFPGQNISHVLPQPVFLPRNCSYKIHETMERQTPVFWVEEHLRAWERWREDREIEKQIEDAAAAEQIEVDPESVEDSVPTGIVGAPEESVNEDGRTVLTYHYAGSGQLLVDADNNPIGELSAEADDEDLYGPMGRSDERDLLGESTADLPSRSRGAAATVDPRSVDPRRPPPPLTAGRSRLDYARRIQMSEHDPLQADADPYRSTADAAHSGEELRHVLMDFTRPQQHVSTHAVPSAKWQALSALQTSSETEHTAYHGGPMSGFPRVGVYTVRDIWHAWSSTFLTHWDTLIETMELRHYAEENFGYLSGRKSAGDGDEGGGRSREGAAVDPMGNIFSADKENFEIEMKEKADGPAPPPSTSAVVVLDDYARSRHHAAVKGTEDSAFGYVLPVGENRRSGFDVFDLPRERTRGAADRRIVKASEVLCDLVQKTVAEKRSVYARLQERARTGLLMLLRGVEDPEVEFSGQGPGAGAHHLLFQGARTRSKAMEVKKTRPRTPRAGSREEGAGAGVPTVSDLLEKYEHDMHTNLDIPEGESERDEQETAAEGSSNTQPPAPSSGPPLRRTSSSEEFTELERSLFAGLRLLPGRSGDNQLEYVPIEHWYTSKAIATQFADEIDTVLRNAKELIFDKFKISNDPFQEAELQGGHEHDHKLNDKEQKQKQALYAAAWRKSLTEEFLDPRKVYRFIRKKLTEEAYLVRVAEIGIFQGMTGPAGKWPTAGPTIQGKTTMDVLSKCQLPGWVKIQYHLVDPWLAEMDEFRLMAEVTDVEESADQVYANVLEQLTAFSREHEPTDGAGDNFYADGTPLGRSAGVDQGAAWSFTPQAILRRSRRRYRTHFPGPFIVEEAQRVGRDSVGLFVHRRNSMKATHNMEDIDVVFLDGDHSLQGFLQDMYAYAGKTQYYASGHDFNLANFPGIGLSLLHSRTPGTPPYEAFGWKYANSTVFLDSDYVWWMRAGKDKW
eukprot:g17058.t1